MPKAKPLAQWDSEGPSEFLFPLQISSLPGDLVTMKPNGRSWLCSLFCPSTNYEEPRMDMAAALGGVNSGNSYCSAALAYTLSLPDKTCYGSLFGLQLIKKKDRLVDRLRTSSLAPRNGEINPTLTH